MKVRDRLAAEAALFRGRAGDTCCRRSDRERRSGGACRRRLEPHYGHREHRATSPPFLAPPATPPPDDSRLSLRTRTADGATQEYRWSSSRISSGSRTRTSSGSSMPSSTSTGGTRAIELLIDGNAVASFEPGAAPSAAENVHVGSAELEGVGEEGIAVTESVLSWEDTSGAGDGRPTYVVQASTDHGETWQTLAVGATQTSLALDSADFADAEQVRFRVLATKGSRTRDATEDLAVVRYVRQRWPRRDRTSGCGRARFARALLRGAQPVFGSGSHRVGSRQAGLRGGGLSVHRSWLRSFLALTLVAAGLARRLRRRSRRPLVKAPTAS